MYKAKSAWMLRDGKGKNAIYMVMAKAQLNHGKMDTLQYSTSLGILHIPNLAKVIVNVSKL
jgi:hypothetical protein